MQVTQEYFEYTMQYAEQLGFETITTEELIGFLYHNDPIPKYSMILIIDDRRLGVVREHFMNYLDKYDWTVTLAYITGVATELEWMEFDRLNVNNRLDLQAHGFMHNADTYITEHTPNEIIEQELYSPIPIIKEKAGRRPDAFIWPGGNFTAESVQMAREAGYQVGFTVYARGPLMYNWIPLGSSEIKVNDPLLVLPRFWSSSATLNLERAVEISTIAKQFAEENEEQEKIWFQNYCSDYDMTNKDD
jgi:peptidoglycan/xylan/chitin deacetylase (PgdA/CDA1 family)